MLGEDGLIALWVVQLLVDVGRKRRLSGRLALQRDPPASLPERLEQLHRSQTLPRAQLARGTRQRLPLAAAERLDQKHLDLAARGPAQMQPRRDDTGVVHHHQLAVQLLGQLAEAALAHLPARALVHEQARLVALRTRPLRDQLER